LSISVAKKSSCKTILSMVDTASKTGFISQIIGPVVDVEFPGGELPTVYSAIVVGKVKVVLHVKYNNF